MGKIKNEDILKMNRYILLFIHSTKEWDDLRIVTYDQALQTLVSIRMIECIDQLDVKGSYRYVRPMDTQLDLCEKR